MQIYSALIFFFAFQHKLVMNVSLGYVHPMLYIFLTVTSINVNFLCLPSYF